MLVNIFIYLNVFYLTFVWHLLSMNILSYIFIDEYFFILIFNCNIFLWLYCRAPWATMLSEWRYIEEIIIIIIISLLEKDLGPKHKKGDVRSCLAFLQDWAVNVNIRVALMKVSGRWD